MKKSYDELYKYIYKSTFQELKVLKMLKIQKNSILFLALLIFVGIIILTGYLLLYYLLIFDGIIVIFYIFKYSEKEAQYNAILQTVSNFIMEQIIELCGEKMHFLPHMGINIKEYKMIKDKRLIDRVYSKNLIEGIGTKRVVLKMSHVVAVKDVRTEDGIKECVIDSGTYGYCKLRKNNISLIELKPNSKVHEYNDFRIETSSAKFESMYDIFASNKVEAMQVINSEVIDLLNSYNQESFSKIQLRIVGDKIFFKMPYILNAFDKFLKNGELNYQIIYLCYRRIQGLIEILDKIMENIEQLDM